MSVPEKGDGAMNMGKAHKSIRQFYEGELFQYSPQMRAALGRRLEVDARFRAIENYLEELTHAVANQVSPGLAGSGLGDSPEVAPEDSPPALPVGRHGRPGETCGCEESLALRECLREALDDFFGEQSDWTARAGELLGDPRYSKIRQLEETIAELRPRAQQTDTARAERDRAAGVIAAARRIEHISSLHPTLQADARALLAKAVKEYDDEEIPF